ncbi:unnamed protein product [Ranitomeya imitator]|uniref:VWFA domain-containing protein n=1 Tax=Ranitomeya imitator TaxID=111125 RepID=A0ABN9MB78_9NEOB|nr:unnamed protein product [Ranitomeya imitator]
MNLAFVIGRVFVHEWAHLRWGVFDEYNSLSPFYIANSGQIEATRCPVGLEGVYIKEQCTGHNCECKRDKDTGLYEDGCVFVPDKNVATKQSIMYLQAVPTSERDLRLVQAAEVFIMQIVEQGSFVGLVEFHSAATIISNLVQITSDAKREQLKRLLKRKAGGGTNICDGIRKGFEVNMGSKDKSTYGTEIVVLSDGEDGNFPGACKNEILNSGAIIHVIALGPSAAASLEGIATETELTYVLNCTLNATNHSIIRTKLHFS